MSLLKNFRDLIAACEKTSTKRRLAVAAADDEHTLAAVTKACQISSVSPVLVGDRVRINSILDKLGYSPEAFRLFPEEDPVRAAGLAVRLVRDGEADFLMKGNCQTADLLREVVNKETGLSKGRLMTHCALFEIPGFKRLIGVSDGGMVLYPDLETKKVIIENMVAVFRKFGYENPKVAVLTCVEKVNPSMPETIEAAELAAMNNRGEIKNCTVAGPISYDIAMDSEVADFKSFAGPVKGDADILIVPDIHAGNILGKALLCSAAAEMAGFIVGATVPIVLSSRAASAREKLLSILASYAALG
ncbi:MAG TPA: phosphate butyryltransferase [Clostridiaceae bacterium]|nr:phosphate butyryltransferase [Clostridiaceae bacterium]